MESGPRDFRSKPSRDAHGEGQESLPFLNTGASDLDVELQSVDDHSDSRSVGSHRSYPPQSSDGGGFSNDLDDEIETYSSTRSPPRHTSSLPRVLTRLLAGVRGKFLSTQTRSHHKKASERTRPLRLAWHTVVVLLMVLGLLQLGALVLGLLSAFFPEKLDHAYRTWRSQDHLNDLSRWPTDHTADILPVSCHSHNDYRRRVPLKSAIQAGCTGVEADVWLFDDDLYVGHDESSLQANRTLITLYIDPLLEILERQNPLTSFQKTYRTPRNGIFDTNPSQTLILLIDFKTSYQELWPVVSAQLEPLRQRQYLTHFNGTAVIQGPVTVVVTGNAPFDYVVADMQYRDMFFDAPLDRLASLSDLPPTSPYDPALELEYLSSIRTTSNKTSASTDTNQGQGHSGHPPANPAIFTRANSLYASVDFKASIGWPRPYLSPAQREKIAAQVAGAHSRGLKVRYWGVPAWPIGLRNYLWRELVKMDIDYLNVDDIYSATKGDWRSGISIWDWSIWGGKDW